MKWIELKSGNIINIEYVYHIFLNGKEVDFRLTPTGYIYEEFDTEEEAKKRMEELKKALL